MYEYKARMLKVVDGDTLDLDIDLGLRVHVKERVRLFGINTPELHSSNADERVAAQKAADFLRSLVTNGVLTVKTQKDSQEKYGRYLATVFDSAGVNVNEEMVKAGHAATYLGVGPMPKWPWPATV